jgi:hypothetical protein
MWKKSGWDWGFIQFLGFFAEKALDRGEERVYHTGR